MNDESKSSAGTTVVVEEPEVLSRTGMTHFVVVGPTLFKHKLSYFAFVVMVFVACLGIFTALNFRSVAKTGETSFLWTWLSYSLLPIAPYIAEALWIYWMIKPYQKVNRSKTYLENCLIGAFGGHWSSMRGAKGDIDRLINYSQEAALRVLIIVDATISIPEFTPANHAFELINTAREPKRVAQMVDAVAYGGSAEAQQPSALTNPRDTLLAWGLLGAAFVTPIIANLVFNYSIFGKMVVMFALMLLGAAAFFQFRFWKDGAVFLAPKTIVYRTPRGGPAKICQSPNMLLVADVRDGTLYFPRRHMPHRAVRCSPAACLLAAWAWVNEADAPTDEVLKRYIDAG